MSLTSINNVKNYLCLNFKEREEIVDGILAAVISQENCLLIGQPGTAKGNLVMEFSKCFQNLFYFQWLLTKYTVPEEIYGALSLKELEIGVYKRNTASKLPEAHIAFLDEIFKSSSAILNTLLTVINEKLYHNNGTPVRVPLISVFGASNEYPEEDESLEALDDRFIIRFEVEYIKDNTNFLSLLQNGINTANRPLISLKDITDLQEMTRKITVGNDILETIVNIKEEMGQEGIIVSDRRWYKSLGVIKANAAINGCQAVDFSHLEILKNVLWRRPDERKTIAPIVKKFCTDQFGQILQDFLQQVEEIKVNALKDKSTDSGTEANKKIKMIQAELKKIKSDNPARAASVDAFEIKIKSINSVILTECLGL